MEYYTTSIKLVLSNARAQLAENKPKNIESYYDPGKDHFSVINQLEDTESLLTQSITK